MAYHVTRQSNYYDEGAYSVEIATALDYAGPGMLVRQFSGESEYDDPREAVEAAIEVSREWRAKIGRAALPYRCFTIAGNAMVYPTVADAMTIPELRAWGAERYNELPKCDRCGEIGAETWRDYNGEEVKACGQFCADEMLRAFYVDEEEVPA